MNNIEEKFNTGVITPLNDTYKNEMGDGDTAGFEITKVSDKEVVIYNKFLDVANGYNDETEISEKECTFLEELESFFNSTFSKENISIFKTNYYNNGCYGFSIVNNSDKDKKGDLQKSIKKLKFELRDLNNTFNTVYLDDKKKITTVTCGECHSSINVDFVDKKCPVCKAKLNVKSINKKIKKITSEIQTLESEFNSL